MSNPTPGSPDGPPLHVVRLEVDSFKRLTAARVEPTTEGLVPIQGQNGHGKSSLIDAMLAALGGAKASPGEPIHTDAHGGSVELDLGEIVVRRRYTRDSGGASKSKLEVVAKGGGPLKSPQAVLDALTGHFADPVAFLELKPQEQARTVLAVLGLTDELERLESVHDGHYARRRDLNRDRQRLEKSVETLELEVRELGLSEEAEDVSALTPELEEVLEHNRALQADEIELARLQGEGQRIASRIEELRAELAQAEEDRERVAGEWKAKKAELADRAHRDPEPIRARIKAAEANAEARARVEVLENARSDFRGAEEAWKEADAAVEASKAEIAELLERADMPVQGMAYDAREKRLELMGVPFEQASQAERLRAAAGVAMAGQPRIRVLFVRDASLLDSASLRLLTEAAYAQGFQVFAEIVADESDGVGVWVEDGEAYNAKPAGS
jgi:DNA repair exonuclease SbcCD ATPase subunit